MPPRLLSDLTSFDLQGLPVLSVWYLDTLFYVVVHQEFSNASNWS